MSPRNGHQPEPLPDLSRQPPTRTTQSLGPGSYEVIVALKMIDRYKSGEIKNEIPVKDTNNVDIPDSPCLFNIDAYDSHSTWNTTWKPEQIEKIYSELSVKDLKNSKEIKKPLKDFRRHVDNLTAEDEVWFCKDITLMHQLSCLNSKKNRNCMGCSTFWKSCQGIHEDLKPWGASDLLRYEPEHSELFFGHIGMNGSFLPQQTQMLACDHLNTLVKDFVE